jgi:protocatechuate 3,4-dioxygenase beta subunit
MNRPTTTPRTRRELIKAGVVGGAALLGATHLKATPEVHETETRSEGPFYKPDAPFRNALVEDGMPGVQFRFTGRMLNTRGIPVGNGLIDLWHANHEGVYDNAGFKLRGRIRTDQEGRFDIRTIMPKEYGSRAAHFHLKLSGDNCRGITTELYFKGNRSNSLDSSVREDLMLDPKPATEGKQANFDFVLRVA